MRKPIAVLFAVLAITAAACSTRSTGGGSSPGGGGGGGNSTSPASTDTRTVGITPTTIKIGITTLDLKAIRSLINLDHGDSMTAYTAVINDINAAGGINGRKIVPYFAPVNPTSTDFSAAACTKLTEDDKVFAVIGFFRNDDALCYTKTHDTPIIGYSLTHVQQKEATAPWFNDQLTSESQITKAVAEFKAQGLFTGRKIAVVAQSSDSYDLNSVAVPALRAAGVDVVGTAINDAAVNDLPSLYSQYKLIEQKFQSEGADMVVMVGNANQSFLLASQVNNLSYKPQVVGLDYNTVLAYTDGSGVIDKSLLTNAVAAGGTMPDPHLASVWNQPALQTCLATITAAHPYEPIGDAPAIKPGSGKQPYVDPVQACQQVHLLADILKAAGTTLNNSTFLSGGESLKNVILPGGATTPLSFGPGSYDGNVPVTFYRWNSATSQFDPTTNVGPTATPTASSTS